MGPGQYQTGGGGRIAPFYRIKELFLEDTCPILGPLTVPVRDFWCDKRCIRVPIGTINLSLYYLSGNVPCPYNTTNMSSYLKLFHVDRNHSVRS